MARRADTVGRRRHDSQRLGGAVGFSPETQQAHSRCCRAGRGGGWVSRRVRACRWPHPQDGERSEGLGRISPASNPRRMPCFGEAHPSLSDGRAEVPGQGGNVALGGAVWPGGCARRTCDGRRLPGVGEAHQGFGGRRSEVPGQGGHVPLGRGLWPGCCVCRARDGRRLPGVGEAHQGFGRCRAEVPGQVGSAALGRPVPPGIIANPVAPSVFVLRPVAEFTTQRGTQPIVQHAVYADERKY